MSVIDDSLKESLEAGGKLRLPGTMCAAACVLGDITVVEHSGFRVGCYVTLNFNKEIFLKNYFDD